MVCTVETLIGNDAEKKKTKAPCRCHSDPVLTRYGDVAHGHQGDSSFDNLVELASGQQVNDSGNEFLSKFLLFGMSSLVYKKDKGVLTKAFEMVSEDLSMLHNRGLQVGGQTYFASTCAVKGDLKFHHQVGKLERSYYNTGVRENHPMCSLCMAGHAAVPFEDLTDSAEWISTLHFERPWPSGNPPSLSTIPFQNDCPEAVFRLDLFHCYKCGLGRDLTGSTLIVLAQLQYFDFTTDDDCNLPARLERAWGSFNLWCRTTGKSPAIHSFSKALLNYKNARSFAWCNVKGSDNTLITSWLLFFIKLSSQNDSRHARLEQVLIETLTCALTVFEILHSHPLWLHRVCAQRVQHHLATVLRGFKVLAKMAKDLSVPAFGLKPKLHACDHISRDIKRQLQSKAPKVLNPLAFSCEANESVVGHVSRISRRVSSRTVSGRVLDRICIKTKLLAKKFKAKLRHRRTTR